jgi:hypothetical protein
LPDADVRLRLYHDTPRSRWLEVEGAKTLETGLAQALGAAGMAAELLEAS